MTPNQRSTYLKTQAIANFLINAVVNGGIAYFSYRSREGIPVLEIAIDAQITLAIIGFLISWLAILGARKNIPGATPTANAIFYGVKLPKNAAGRALFIMLLMMIALGGLITGGVTLLSPGGVSNWGYIILKTLYTGAAAFLASWMAILSVFSEQPGKVIQE